jgi:asparagine synthase (glutamine-hydrolysing)
VALVDAMRASIRHRGPDEGSTVVSGRCALGHQRLVVLDPERGRQPAASESGEVLAVHNGEIYNFPELRGELAGHTIPGTGDTAVIPHVYEESGAEFARRLHGMFAIGLWDAPRERLVLARDRLGKKPLLWTRLEDGTFAFASELRALLLLPGLRRAVDLESLDQFLALQYIPGTRTAVRGVHELAPGHALVVEGGSERAVRYWEPQPRGEAGSDEDWLAQVRAAVGAAVRRRLASDVPLGALLSGGIDSSIVVAEMAKAASSPVRTFTIGFGEERYDEREHARAVAERYGTRHEEIELDAQPAELLPELAQAFDEPLGDEAALPLYAVCGAGRQHVTVALTGDGGDEAFAGYERYAALELAQRIPQPVARAASSVLGLARATPHVRSPLVRARRFLDAAASPARERYGRIMEVFPAAARAALWTDDALSELAPLPGAAALLPPLPTSDVRALQLADLATYLPHDLLRKSDLASMSHSMELRSPFLDHEVIELGLALPRSLKIRGRTGKVALRLAYASELPEEILARRKTGFGVPIARWFRGELREPAREILLSARARQRGYFRPGAVERLLREHADGRHDHAHRLWCLLMLELWHEAHLDGRAAAEQPVAASA